MAMNSPSETGDSAERLDAILADYLDALKAGTAPGREEVLARHPDLAPRLKAFFLDRDYLRLLEDRAARQAAARGSLGPPPPSFSPGEVFAGFAVIGVVSQGEMGVVYRARRIADNRDVALKVIRCVDRASEARIRRFRLEARAAEALEHPHIVPVYETGEFREYCFIAMKYLEGGNLAQSLNRLTGDFRTVARLVETVARAVQYAHDRGVLHRDLKPSNILLDADGEPYVTDFGLAKFLEVDACITQPGTAVGTPRYMAPEQVKGDSASHSPATDVYSLGVVLYELIAGSPPFSSPSTVELLEQIVRDEPPPPGRWEPRLSRDLETICLKCLEKKPERRYASARDLADDLRRYRERRAIRARPTPPALRALRWARRRPVAATLLAVGILALLALAHAGVHLGRSPGAAREAERARRLFASRLVYANRVRIAFEMREKGAEGRSQEILEGLIPSTGDDDPRSFEWYHLLHEVGPRRAAPAKARGASSPDRPEISLAVDADVPGAFVAVRADLAPTRWRLGAGGRLERPGPANPAGAGAGHSASAVSPDATLLAAAGPGRELEVWRLDWQEAPPRGRIDARLGVPPLTIHTLRFSPAGRLLVSAGDRGTVKVWRRGAAAREPLWGLEESFDVSVEVGAAVFSGDERLLAMLSGGEGTVLLRDLRRRRPLRLPERSRRAIRALAFSADSQTLALGRADGAVGIWRLIETDGRVSIEDRGSLSSHAGPVGALAFSPDGKVLVSGGSDGSVRIWDVLDAGDGAVSILRASLRGLLSDVRVLLFAPHGRALLAGGGSFQPDRGELSVWRAADPR